MSIGDAAHNYVLLAIGDALVAQLPSLMLSIAAAAIVTRVNSKLDLAGQIGSQFGSHRTWTPVAVILALLGVLPGMPHFVILPAAATAGFAAWKMRQIANRPPPPGPLARAGRRLEDRLGGSHRQHAGDARHRLRAGTAGRRAPRRPADGADHRGPPRSSPRSWASSCRRCACATTSTCAPFTYRIVIGGVVVGEDNVSPDEMLALDTGQAVGKLPGKMAKDPTFGLDAVWINAARRRCRDRGGLSRRRSGHGGRDASQPGARSRTPPICSAPTKSSRCSTD